MLGGLLGGYGQPLTPEEEILLRYGIQPQRWQQDSAPPPAPLPEPEPLSFQQTPETQPTQPVPTERPPFLREGLMATPEQAAASPLSPRMVDVATSLAGATDPVQPSEPVKFSQLEDDDDFEVVAPPKPVVQTKPAKAADDDDDFEIVSSDVLRARIMAESAPRPEGPATARLAERAKINSQDRQREANAEVDRVDVKTLEQQAFDSQVLAFYQALPVPTDEKDSRRLAKEAVAFARDINEKFYGGEAGSLDEEAMFKSLEAIRSGARKASRVERPGNNLTDEQWNEAQRTIGQALSDGTITQQDFDKFNLPSMGQSIGKGAATARQLAWASGEAFAEMVGADGVAKTFGDKREYYNAILRAAPKGVSLGEIDSLSSALQWASQTLGEQGALMAAPLGGAIAGRVVAGSVGAKLGAIPASLAMGLGEVQAGNKEADPNTKAGLATLLGGSAVALLDSITPGRLGNVLVDRFGPETANELAQRMLLMNAPERVVELGRRATVEGARDSAAEFGTEAIQTAIAEIATAQETGKPITPGMLSRALEAGFTGAFVGGVAGGATSVAGDLGGLARQRNQPQEPAPQDPAGLPEGATVLTDFEPARPVALPREQRGQTPPRKVAPTPAPVDEEGREQKFVLPSGKVTSVLGRRKSFQTENGKMASSDHKGFDIAKKLGAPVEAMADGVVVGVRENAGGYGKQVVIRHSDGTTSSYSHGSRHIVEVGQQVKQGEAIMRAGKSGNATGVHVHVELRGRDGRVLNPLTAKPVRVTRRKQPDGKVALVDDTGFDVVENETLPVAEVEQNDDWDMAWEEATGTTLATESEVDEQVRRRAPEPATPAPSVDIAAAAEEGRDRIRNAGAQDTRQDLDPRVAGPTEEPLFEVDENGNETVIGFNDTATGQQRFLADIPAESAATIPPISEPIADEPTAIAGRSERLAALDDRLINSVGPDGTINLVLTPQDRQAFLRAGIGFTGGQLPSERVGEILAEQQARAAEANDTPRSEAGVAAGSGPPVVETPPPSIPERSETVEPQEELRLRDDQRADVIFRDPFPATGGLELTSEYRERPDLAAGNFGIGALENLATSIESSQPNAEGRVPLPSGTRGEAVAALRDMGMDIRQSDLTISGADAALLREEGVEGLAQRYAPRDDADTLDLNLTVADAKTIFNDAMRSVSGSNEDVAAGFAAGARRALGLNEEAMTPELADRIANNKRFRMGFDRGETVAANLAENRSRGTTNPVDGAAPIMAGPTERTATAAPAMRSAEAGQVATATGTPTPEAVATTPERQATETVTPEAARIIYRGTSGSSERIAGGIAEGTLFAAPDERTAGLYGDSIEAIGVREGAKILREGTAEFARVTGRRRGPLIRTMRQGENMATAGTDAVEKARAAGYDAVEFDSAENGIAIINEGAFIRNYGATETVTPAPAAPSAEPSGSTGPTGQNTGGWVVRDRATGEPVLETAQRSVTEKVNAEKYEVVPALQHLQELNQPETKAAQWARREEDPAPEPAADPRRELLATLPKPADDANPAVAAGRILGQEVGLGLAKPANLKSRSKAFKTAYNLGLKEGQTAAAQAEAVEPEAEADTVPAADEGVVATPTVEALATTPEVSQRLPEAKPMRGLGIKVALSRVADRKGNRQVLDAGVQRWLSDQGFIEVSNDGVETLTERGMEVVATAQSVDRKAEAYDDRLFTIETDDSKGAARTFAQKLVREGVMDQAELDAMAWMWRDKDMDASDITSELRTNVELWAERQLEEATGVQYQKGDPYNPQRRAEMDAKLRELGPKMEAEAKAELAKMGLLGRADLQVTADLPDGAQGAFIRAFNLIRLAAMNTKDAAATTRHEAIHWARANGIFTKAEWAVMAKWASNQPGLMKWARDKYNGPNVPKDQHLSEDALIEEAVAEGFSRIMGGQPVKGGVEGILTRLAAKLGKAVAVVREVLGRNGITRQERADAMRLFASFYSGEQVALADSRLAEADTAELETAEDNPNVMFSRSASPNAVLGDPSVPNPGAFRQATFTAVEWLRQKASQDPSKTIDRTERFRDVVKRKFQNKYNTPFRVYEQVMAIYGGQLPPEADMKTMVVADERGYRINWLQDNLVTPMAKAISEKGVDLHDLGMFLMARHAPARNAKVAGRNKEFNDPNTPGKAGSGMTDPEAAQVMADFRTEGKWDALNDIAENYIDKIIEFSTQERVNAGLLTPTDLAQAFQKGEFYVPLRGHDTDPEHEMDFGVERSSGGGGFSIRGPEGRRMFGRASQADPEQIVGYVLGQAGEAVSRAYRAKVAQSVLSMLQKVPPSDRSDFVQIDKVERRAVWIKGKNGQGGHVEYQMQTRLSPKEEERTIFVKIDGELHKITARAYNPSAMRFVKAIKNMDPAQVSFWLAPFRMFSTWFRMMNTQYSPEFIAANPAKDAQTALVNASTAGVKGVRRAILYNLVTFGPAVGALRQAIQGKGDKSAATGVGAEWLRTMEELEANGGTITYGNVDPMKTALKNLQLETKRQGRGMANPVRLFSGAFQLLEIATTTTENMTRLAVYKALRDKGMDAKRAAAFTREVTTNFSQHGELGPELSMAYAFANASIVGSARLAETFIKKPQLFGGLIAFGMVAAATRIGLDDEEDDDSHYTEEELDQHVIIPMKYLIGTDITIPAGWGVNVPMTIGRKMVELATGHRKEDGTKMTALDAMGDILMSAHQAFVPISGQTLATAFAPTLLDIPIAHMENKSFWGNPIYPEQSPFAKREKPDSELMWSKTEGSAWETIADKMNYWTGGDSTGVTKGEVSVSPETLRYMMDQLGGGLGRTIQRTITQSTNEADDDWKDIPIVRRFVRQPGGSMTKEDRSVSNYEKRIRETKEVVEQAKELKLRGAVEFDEFKEENAGIVAMRGTDDDPKGMMSIKLAEKLDRQLDTAASAVSNGYVRVDGLNEKQARAVAKALGREEEEIPVGRKLTTEEVREYREEIKARRVRLATKFNRTYREMVLGQEVE